MATELHLLIPNAWMRGDPPIAIPGVHLLASNQLGDSGYTQIHLSVDEAALQELTLLALSKVNNLTDRAEATALAQLCALHMLKFKGVGTPTIDPDFLQQLIDHNDQEVPL